VLGRHLKQRPEKKQATQVVELKTFEGFRTRTGAVQQLQSVLNCAGTLLQVPFLVETLILRTFFEIKLIFLLFYIVKNIFLFFNYLQLN